MVLLELWIWEAVVLDIGIKIGAILCLWGFGGVIVVTRA